MSNEIRSSWVTRSVGVAGGLFLGLLPVIVFMILGVAAATVGFFQGLQNLTF